MRPSHVILLLLILAHLLLVLCFRLTFDPDWCYAKGPEHVCWLEVFVTAQASLVAIWGAIGRSSILIRIPGVLLAFCGLSTILLFDAKEAQLLFQAWSIMFVVQALMEIIPLAGLRWFGFKFISPLDTVSAETKNAPRNWQFSVANMLFLTAGIAMLAAAWLRAGAFRVDWGWVQLSAMIVARFALPVPLLVWALLSPRRVETRLTVAVIVAVAIVAIWPMMWSNSRWMWAFTTAQFSVVALSLLVVRIAGYRFARQAQA
jgi:hypothetical protein